MKSEAARVICLRQEPMGERALNIGEEDETHVGHFGDFGSFFEIFSSGTAHI